MKKLLFVLLTVLSTTSFAQSFNGITIGGKLSEFVSAMKEKGYTYVKATETGGAIMSGTLSGNIVELWISVTPKTKLVWKLSIYFPENDSWYSMKSEYEKYKSALTEKYGTPDKTFEFFKSPYYDGDGYEMTAVRVEKAVFSTYWIKNESNYAISLSITKFSQLRISYENVRNSSIDDKEKKEINNTTL